MQADPERLVLPALLALLIVGMFLILVTSGGSEQALGPPPPVAAQTTSSQKGNATPRTGPAAPTSRRFAKVGAGDTASSIATAAGLSVDRLGDLNPSIDLDTLRLGQTLKLAP